MSKKTNKLYGVENITCAYAKRGKAKNIILSSQFYTDDTNLWNKQIDILNENFISDRHYSHK